MAVLHQRLELVVEDPPDLQAVLLLYRASAQLASFFLEEHHEHRVKLPGVGTLREALVVVAMGIMVVSVGTFVLVIFEDLTLRQVLFEVVSAFGTVGLSTGITPGLSVAGKLTLMIIMLTGRIGPLTLALAIGQRDVRSRYDYPEGRVVVG